MEQGFSLAAALLLVLVGLFSTLAIAGRTLGSRQKTLESSQAQSARDAAEIGMTRIIAELNRPRNRRLLVNGPQLNASGKTVANIAGDADLINPCDSVNSASPDLSTNGTFNSGNILNNEVTIAGTNNRMRYQLIAVNNGTNDNEQAANGDANTAFDVTVGNPGPPGTNGQSGTITLDVRGIVYDANNTEVSRYNLRKTYAVIPKCCDSSFGGFTGTGTTSAYASNRWGNDSATCGVASGYGMILGSRRDLTDLNTKGSLSTQLAVLLERTVNGTATTSTINRTYCTVPTSSPVPTDCQLTSSLAIVLTRLTLKDIGLPAVPYPQSTGTYAYTANQQTLTQFSTTRGTTTYPNNFLNASGCSSGSCNIADWLRMRVCDAEINGSWPGATGTGTGTAVPRSTSTASLSSASPAIGCRITVTASETLNTRDFATWINATTNPGNTLKWHLGRLCRQVSNWGGVSGNTVIYCNLDSLTLSGATITFDTAGSTANTSIPIILSFPNGGNTIGSIKTILGSGTLASGSLVQTNSQRTIPRLNDLSIYGCAINQQTTTATPCRFQLIQSGFLSTLTLRNVFVYAPYSTMQANLSFLAFRGAYWGNKLSQTISGSQFIIPAGTVDSVVNSFPSWTPAQLDREQDYVARSVISVSSF